METFMKVFEESLYEAITKFPEMYGYGPEKVSKTCELIREAIPSGNFVKDTPAMKMTCKKLGIKPLTYKAIKSFIENHV